MTVTELIARAAKRLIEADPEIMGVRVCPITLEPEDVEPLRKQIQAQVGKKTYVAMSVPGVQTVDVERFYVSADQSAAERATRHSIWSSASSGASQLHSNFPCEPAI